jgi:hypothetical protein
MKRFLLIIALVMGAAMLAAPESKAGIFIGLPVPLPPPPPGVVFYGPGYYPPGYYYGPYGYAYYRHPYWRHRYRARGHWYYR